jgi:predicted phosphodiesterase
MYKYTHFIPENTAPTGATKIGVYDSTGKKVCTIPLGGLTPPVGEKLYSFGLVSDIHIYPIAAVNWTPETKFRNALTFLEEQGCSFCVHCGDFTNTGLTLDDQDASTGLDLRQFATYKGICDEHPNLPVYGVCGNHESITNQDAFAMKNNRDLLIEYTGKDLYFTVEQGNDVFIFPGQPNWNVVMDSTEFQWLRDTLEANRNRRCFVFIHSYLEEDSGDPMDYRENSIFNDVYWGSTNRKSFMDLMAQYPNAILFHGHSHTKYECQQYDKTANYTEKNGFKSVHVPSLSMPRFLDLVNGKTTECNDESQGYIVDVYAECIVLNGWDFVNNQYVPLGVYKIAT